MSRSVNISIVSLLVTIQGLTMWHFLKTTFDMETKRPQTLEEQIRIVLKPEVAFAAKDFSSDSFTNSDLFPNIGIMRGEGITECPFLTPNLENEKIKGSNTSDEWYSLLGNEPEGGYGKKFEILQDVGFINMLRFHYPKSFSIVSDPETASRLSLKLESTTSFTDKTAILLKDLINMSPVPRVFLPFCGTFPNGTRQMGRSGDSFGQKPLDNADSAISSLERVLTPSRIFYVSPHPGTRSNNWEKLINNARALKIDQCTRGFFNDIIIPVSTIPSLCDYDSPRHQIGKQNLIYSCGGEHSKKYKGLRQDIPDLFNSLVNTTGIDMAKRRSRTEYMLGFYKSKFCFVLPGDTTATSQASRAMCAGCVPIFIALDFRELPLSNILDYNSFSIRIRSNYFTTNNASLNYERASNMYKGLQEMVLNGTFDELKRNVMIARDFFNYHRFGSRSPYGGALVSMNQDEVSERQY